MNEMVYKFIVVYTSEVFKFVPEKKEKREVIFLREKKKSFNFGKKKFDSQASNIIT